MAGKSVTWKYSYDKKGRLLEAHLDGRLISQCYYDKQGRRMRDYLPATAGPNYRDYQYTMDNRLLRTGNNTFTHDDNGFRSIWSSGGTYHLYDYSPDYRLLKMEVEDENRVFSFRHNENGQRAAKYFNGQLVEAYQWLDFIRLGAFHDSRMGYEFGYEDGERLPVAMRREDGAVFTLHYDQVGSLRAVAAPHGNVIKEVLYDPFGGIIKDTNPTLRIPIGFAGGLHDRDLGFARFGWRDYDANTGRGTAPDPIGDRGGDSDWYGYCLDAPVNGVDPLGLFRFGKRGLGPLPLLGIFSDNPLDDRKNTEIAHEHGFFEDGSSDNIGLFDGGVKKNTEEIKEYELDDKIYDDKRMRRAYKSVGDQSYNLIGWKGKKKNNNCQDYADTLRKQYHLFERGDRQR